MKKLILALMMLMAIASFTSCTDLTEEEDETFDLETRQVDPATVKPPTGG